MKLKPLVITGASGFVGANLCRYFLERGHHVIALTGSTRAHWRLPEPSARFQNVSVDLSSEKAIREFVARTQPSAFVNCAAYGAYSNQTDSSKIYQVNFDAVRYLIESLRQVEGFKAFIQMGSSSEYGLNCKAPKESDPTLPDSEYAVSKVAATALCQFYGKKHAFPAWVFRLYSVYGPYEDASRLIVKLLIHAQKKKLPPLVNPKISRDFIYMDDVSRAVEAVIEQSATLPRGEAYNIGTGTCTTLETLVATARESFHIEEVPQWGSMPDRRWDHPDWYSHPAKAERDFGWQATVGLREGLQKTMHWINEHPDAMLSASQHSVTSSGTK